LAYFFHGVDDPFQRERPDGCCHKGFTFPIVPALAQAWLASASQICPSIIGMTL
jgi:hypothetical protein